MFNFRGGTGFQAPGMQQQPMQQQPMLPYYGTGMQNPDKKQQGMMNNLGMGMMGLNMMQGAQNGAMPWAGILNMAMQQGLYRGQK